MNIAIYVQLTFLFLFFKKPKYVNISDLDAVLLGKQKEQDDSQIFSNPFIFLINSQKLLCKQLDNCLLNFKLYRFQNINKIMYVSFSLLMLFFVCLFSKYFSNILFFSFSVHVIDRYEKSNNRRQCLKQVLQVKLGKQQSQFCHI